MRLRKSLRMAAVVTGLALAMTACAGDDDADETGDDTEQTDDGADDGAEEGDGDAEALPAALQDGDISVCTDVPYRPFEFEEEGTATGYSGFDIELVEAMAAEVGVDVTIQVTGFDAIQSGTALAADSCDIAASAMTITEEREENVDFLDPYFDADQSLLVKTDGPTSLDEVTSLGVQADTTGQAYAEENFDGDITEFPDSASLFSALEGGTIDAILQDLPVNAERGQQDDSTTIVETFPTGEQYGFAVAEGETELRDTLNDALQSVRDAGTYDELFAKYFDA
jgi:polar amino acid transport system substrate-binding protein